MTQRRASVPPAASVSPLDGVEPATPARRRRASAAVKTPARTGRTVARGDVSPSLQPATLARHVAQQAVQAADGQQTSAVLSLLGSDDATQTTQERIDSLRALLAGASQDDLDALREALRQHMDRGDEESDDSVNPDEELARDWRRGAYPYRNLLRRSTYEREKFRLQVELLKLQAWVKETGQRVVILFEGRDAAGKGGTIKRFMEHLNPRGARVVALQKPTETERGQWYFQRYVQHLPTQGEIVMFDRSWYNRAGVERVMGFCSDDEYEEFFRTVPEFEKMLVRSGIKLVKYWFSITDEEQHLRFLGRIHDPLKQWKLSPMDLESRVRWEAYTKAKETMLERTHIAEAPWWVVQAVDKKKARLNCIHHLLSQLPYQEVPHAPVVLPERVRNPEYLRQPVPASMYVPEVY